MILIGMKHKKFEVAAVLQVKRWGPQTGAQLSIPKTQRKLLMERIDMDSANKDLSHSINCSYYSFNRSIPPICQDRICLVCSNDHSFRNNFAGVKTSIDLIPKLLPGPPTQSGMNN